jgi:hypothetical protein
MTLEEQAKKYASFYKTKLERVVAEEAFMDGARRHITPSELETVATAIYEERNPAHRGMGDLKRYSDLHEDYMKDAKAALSALGIETTHDDI